MSDVSAHKSIHSSRGQTELTRLNTRKAPRYDLISGQILKRLPRKTVVLFTVILNRMLTLSYFPVVWKYAEIIMIPKPGKPPHTDPSVSYL